MLSNYTPDNLVNELDIFLNNNSLADIDIAKELKKYLTDDCVKAFHDVNFSISSLNTFWPPRFIDYIRKSKSIIFFGAGMSMPCGLPGWNQMLSEYFGVDKGLVDDEDLQADPLTLAELVCQNIGHESLQKTLRKITEKASKYSINHILLAALRLPVYITTNYDTLFEKAWKALNKQNLPVIVNDSDLVKSEVTKALNESTGVLYKIHGCAERSDEYLILTRKDYRNHYRLNRNFFNKIKEYLRNQRILFLGFSHKDPEVSRLVEDIIYEFENCLSEFRDKKKRPHFFSLQFDMRKHTPEVFAARGIVALRPPLVNSNIETLRTHRLGIALCDLLTHKAHSVSPNISLYKDIAKAKKDLSEEIDKAIKILENQTNKALKVIKGKAKNLWMKKVVNELADFASQGLYLTDDQGNVIAFETPKEIPKNLRITNVGFSQRPYFQQAKSFRKAFLADSAKSVFNEGSTIFFCCPVQENESMHGLLFSACQIGQWETPLKIAKRFWKKNLSFILVDSNGICLLPPNQEFNAKPLKEKNQTYLKNKYSNKAFLFDKLLSLSRRDVLVSHISNSVVPILLDDDVVSFSEDLTHFSVISEIEKTHWKIAISAAITK